MDAGTKKLLMWGGLGALALYLFTQSSASAAAAPAAANPVGTSGVFGTVAMPNGTSVTLQNSQVSMATGVMTAQIQGINYAIQAQADGTWAAVAITS